MKEQPEESNNRAHNSFRPVRQFGVAAAVAAIVLATAFYLSHKSKPAGSKTAEDTTTTTSATTDGTAAALKQSAAGASGETEPNSINQWIKNLNDTSLPLSERTKAIQALAKNGSQKALAALKDALNRSPSEIRQAIAEALGECPSSEGLTLLVELLQDPDADVARAAVRGLGKQEQPQAASALAQVVNDAGASSDVRCEAVMALGAIGQSWVLDPLSRAAKDATDDDLVKTALNSMGQLDFNYTKGFFQDYLQSPDTSPEMRLAAVDALAQAQGDPTPLLLQLAGRDSDPDIRAAAAWAMSATDATGQAGAALLALLSSEAEPDVRLRLYQALRNQESFATQSALQLVQNEKDPSARVAGFDLLAKLLRDNPTSQLQSFFDQIAIPELKQIALGAGNLDDRQAAVIALTRAHTREAMAALTDLSSQTAQGQNTAPGASTTPARPIQQIGSLGMQGQH